MRTTLTLTADIAAALEETALRTGRSFEATVNETLRAGLANPSASLPARPYRLEPASLGGVEPDFSLDKALRLVECLEDRGIACGLLRRNRPSLKLPSGRPRVRA